MTHYHVSEWYKPERDGPLKPQVPDDTGDDDTERICAAPSVGQCLAGMFAWPSAEFFVYAIDEEPDIVITKDIEPDADETGETWYTRPVLPRYVGTVLTVADYECGVCRAVKPGRHWGSGPGIPFDEGYEWTYRTDKEEL